MSEIELAVFDMAGTTVRDEGHVAAALSAALAEREIVPTPEQLNGVRGSSKRQAVLSFIPEGPERAAAAEAVYASFREHLTRRYEAVGVEPVEGAEQTFRRLREQGIRVALNTGFDRDITGMLLAALNWERGVVDAVVCGDDVRQGRPAPYLIFRAMEATNTAGVRQVANVGDTVLDMQAGYNAGARLNVGVLYGAHGRGLLGRAPHTHLAESLTEVLEVIMSVRERRGHSLT